MPEKSSVTIPLNTRQKAAIKKATGSSINAIKVEKAAGRTVLKTARIKLTRRFRPPGEGPYTPGI